MESSKLLGFFAQIPRKTYLCHVISCSLYNFARTGEPRVVSEEEGLRFALLIEYNLGRAKKISTREMIPPHLYSVFAVQIPEFPMISHTAFVADVEPQVLIAESFCRPQLMSFEDFMEREKRNASSLYEFSFSLLEEFSCLNLSRW